MRSTPRRGTTCPPSIRSTAGDGLAQWRERSAGGSSHCHDSCPTGGRWSVKYLAERVAMSPSRFAARFVAALGESPMVYVTKWRMNVASRLLGSTRRPVSEIAADVGYENLAAFRRAFKRHIGVPPAAWRSSQAS